MLKKILIGFIVFFVLVIGALISIPFLFKDKLTVVAKEVINENVNAIVDFEKVDLSLISNFPKASFSLSNIHVINKEPFLGDTLFCAGELSLQMSIWELLTKQGESVNVQGLSLDKASVLIKTDKEGNANYDIAKKSGQEEEEKPEEPNSSSESFTFSLNKYSLTNSKITYWDELSNMKIDLFDINHFGNGDLSAEKTSLDTETSAVISFVYDSVGYFKNMPIDLDAVLELDLANSIYTFKENTAHIRKMALKFSGFIQLLEKGQKYDLNFSTPTSDFKNFIAIIPEDYTKDLESIQTKGDFELEGFFKGLLSEKEFPNFNLKVNANNGEIHYPDMPNSITGIQLSALIGNRQPSLESSFLELQNLSFGVLQDKFNLKGNVEKLIGDPLVNMKAKGTLNLTELKNTYPLELDQKLQGKLKANLQTQFLVSQLSNSNYTAMNNSGELTLTDFHVESPDFNHPIDVEEAKLIFDKNTAEVPVLKAKIGESDFSASGKLSNYLGLINDKNEVVGTLKINSNKFSVNDFLTEESESEESSENTEEKTQIPASSDGQQISIPKNYNFTMNATAKEVLYQDMTLKNVLGDLAVRNQKVYLNNLSSDFLGGRVVLKGDVATGIASPDFKMSLDLQSVDILKAATDLKVFSFLAPISKVINGKINTNLNFNGKLNDDFSPNLSTLSGDALAQIISATIPKGNSTLNNLTSKLDFINLDDLKLDKTKINFGFEDGKVKVKPFDVKYKDFAINLSGEHSLDNQMNYAVSFDVPAKYLSDLVGNSSLISGLESSNITIPIAAKISGDLNNPNVTTDLKNSVSNLTSQLVQGQKQKLVEKGKKEAGNLISGLLSGNKKDSSAQKAKPKEQIKDAAKGLINGLFKKKK